MLHYMIRDGFWILMPFPVQIHAVTTKSGYKNQYQNGMFILLNEPVFNVLWVVLPFLSGVLWFLWLMKCHTTCPCCICLI